MSDDLALTMHFDAHLHHPEPLGWLREVVLRSHVEDWGVLTADRASHLVALIQARIAGDAVVPLLTDRDVSVFYRLVLRACWADDAALRALGTGHERHRTRVETDLSNHMHLADVLGHLV